MTFSAEMPQLPAVTINVWPIVNVCDEAPITVTEPFTPLGRPAKVTTMEPLPVVAHEPGGGGQAVRARAASAARRDGLRVFMTGAPKHTLCHHWKRTMTPG